MAYEPHFKECPMNGKQGVEVHDPGCKCDYIGKMMEQQAEEDDAEQGFQEYVENMDQLERDEESRQLAADAQHEEAELRRMEDTK